MVSPKTAFVLGWKAALSLFLAAIRVDKREVDAQIMQRDAKQVKGAAIDGGRADHMVSGIADIHDGIEICLYVYLLDLQPGRRRSACLPHHPQEP